MISIIIKGSLSKICGNLAINLEITSIEKAKLQAKLISSSAYRNSESYLK